LEGEEFENKIREDIIELNENFDRNAKLEGCSIKVHEVFQHHWNAEDVVINYKPKINSCIIRIYGGTLY
jgi:hypothetical protein